MSCRRGPVLPVAYLPLSSLPGCLEGIVPHLPSLIPFLINTLSDPKPLVRAITCWTIGRYSSWCVSASTPDAQTQYFLPAMEGLLRMVLDNNKRVQEAGCSAFATLEEEAGTLLLPFLEPIIRNLVFAFSKYQQKNLLILYDAIGTLADSVGEGLNNPALIEILMPPLIEKWNRLTDSDEDIIPLLECLSSVTIAASESFAKYAVPVYERCLKMVQACLADYWAWTSNPAQLDEPDKTFLIVSLDLLSGLTQGLKANMSDLIVPAGTPAESLPPLIQLLEACLNHPEASVRQSAYALLGDMAISCPALNHYLALYLPRIVKEISDQVAAPKYEEVSVCNNAAWAVGEMAMQCQPTPTNPNPALKVPLGQHVAQLVEALIRILINTTTPKSLLENAAVTIGRLGLVYPDVVAVHLETFGKTWCTVLWDIKDNEEKGSAFQGFCQLVMLNPQGMLPVSSLSLAYHSFQINLDAFLPFPESGPRLLLQRDLQVDDPLCRAERDLPQGPHLVQGDARPDLGSELPVVPCGSPGAAPLAVQPLSCILTLPPSFLMFV